MGRIGGGQGGGRGVACFASLFPCILTVNVSSWKGGPSNSHRTFHASGMCVCTLGEDTHNRLRS